MRLRSFVITVALASMLAAPGPGHAASVSLTANLDNTLYEDGTGGISNGAGAYLFAGKAAGLRRALVAFDVAGNIPANSTITAATLTLTCSRTNPFNPTVTLNLHRVLASWGEGTSDASEPGGAGTSAETGDATWIHRFHNTTLWSTAGGDFDATASAGQSVTGLGSYIWGSTAAMVADVQAWLDTPSSNAGWILIGEEAAQLPNAKRFNSREHPEASLRPTLDVTYDLPPVGVESNAWTAVKALYR